MDDVEGGAVTKTVEQIAAGLTKQQVRYILAVGDAGLDYYPRHGVTANWALRHGFVDTMLHFEDGRTVPWGDGSARLTGDYTIGGQRLSPLGLAVRAHLQKDTQP